MERNDDLMIVTIRNTNDNYNCPNCGEPGPELEEDFGQFNVIDCPTCDEPYIVALKLKE